MANIGEKEETNEAAAHRQAAADRLAGKTSIPTRPATDEETAEKRTKLSELFAQYDEADLEVENCKSALETATVARSEVVRKMANVIAPQKRLRRNGRELSVVQRDDTFFLRGVKERPKDMIDI